MAPSQASERLRELQAQAARDSAALSSEIEAGSSQTQQRATSFRTASSHAQDPEDRPLLSRLSAVKELTNLSATTWKVWVAVLAAAVCSVALLWLLFGGDDAEMYVATKELAGKPLTASELKIRHPNDPCPEGRWFPSECLTDERTKSATVHDRCQGIFADLGYSTDLLISCGLMP